MIRKLRSAALLLTAPAALGLGLAAASPASAAVHAGAPAAACTSAGPIEINGFAFSPPEVSPGQSSTADLITTNCTNSNLDTMQTWTAQWLVPTGGSAPVGCPVIDPLVRHVDYLPGQELAVNTTYTVPATCNATELAVTVRINVPTGSAPGITATAYLQIQQVSPAS